jgi:hypothetical protein
MLIGVGAVSRSCAWVVCAASLASCQFSVHASGDGGLGSDAALTDALIDAASLGSDARDATDAGIGAAWWNSAYKHRLAITIAGADLQDNLTDFPVMVKLAAAGPFVFADANANGDDLVFIDSDGSTVLDYDIDDLHTNGPWWIWVKVPTLTKSVNHVITLYYANPSATPTASGSNTFSDDVSVHHLGATFADETGHGHTGVATGTTRGNGLMGGSTTFNGTSDVVRIPHDAAYDFTNAMTVSAWIQAPNATTFTGYEPFVAKGDHTWRIQSGSTSAGIGTNDTGQFGTSHTGTDFDNVNGMTTIDNGTWHHIAATYNGTTKALYVDGVLDGSDTLGQSIFTNSNDVLFGENEDAAPKRWFGGNLDEVRITNVVRPIAWLRAEHDTVTITTFTRFGADQPYP